MSSTINPPTARSVASSVQPAHPESVAATIPRRHDLDALRAIAMLLGIALHGALSFFPMPDAGWSIHDVRQSSVFGLFTALIHGFRMPLFFLISGFFTAMLWRKRGLRSLLKQRFKRVFLPLMIGMVTIIPAVWVVIIGTAIYQAQSPGTQGEENLWTAARSGNLEVIQSEIAAGAPLNQRDPIFGATPLALATWQGNTDIMEALIAGGAEVNARNRDGATPLHGAALLGRSEAFDMLISHGASLAERDRAGSTPTDQLDASWGRTMIVVGFMGAVVDQDSLFEGRKAIVRRLQSERSDPAVEATAAPIVAANEISKIDRTTANGRSQHRVGAAGILSALSSPLVSLVSLLACRRVCDLCTRQRTLLLEDAKLASDLTASIRLAHSLDTDPSSDDGVDRPEFWSGYFDRTAADAADTRFTTRSSFSSGRCTSIVMIAKRDWADAGTSPCLSHS